MQLGGVKLLNASVTVSEAVCLHSALEAHMHFISRDSNHEPLNSLKTPRRTNMSVCSPAQDCIEELEVGGDRAAVGHTFIAGDCELM